MRHHTTRTTLALATALLITGCAQKSSHDAVVPTTQTTITPCPVVMTGPHRWASPIPSDVPWPTSGVEGATTKSNGLTYVRFSSSASLREELVPLLKALRIAGFAIGRGDAESHEADVPFARAQLRGLFKLVRVEKCQTDWILALGHNGGGGSAPVVPTYSPRPSATPLPFG